MRRTIVQAIIEVMKLKGSPMTVIEVYDAIMRDGLYSFNTDNPVYVVRSQIRRHCAGIDFPSALPTKHFSMQQNGTYWLLDASIKVDNKETPEIHIDPVKRELLTDLKRLHEKYLADFRQRLLNQLKNLDPSTFELFSKKLLEAYGFCGVMVTSRTRDGGIDGYGQLKIGLAFMNVAFQCKRWKQNNVVARHYSVVTG